jgi:plasmid stabilization system protein ParE
LTAENDLREIEEYIARDSVLHAVNFVDRLVESTDKLAVSPRAGRVVPEFGREELREVLFRGYRVVYLLRGDTVTVLRVVHGARDLASLMAREPWDFS